MRTTRIVTLLARRDRPDSIRHRYQFGVTGLAVGIALLAASARIATAQAACEHRGGFGREIALTLVSVAAVGTEFSQMDPSAAWKVSRVDAGSVISDPSSHLHALGSYAIASGVAASARARCTTPRRAAWMGAAFSAAFGVAKEVADGYYEGFSTADLAMDGTGIALAVATTYVPALRHVTPAFSYDLRARPPGGLHGHLTNYGAQTFWLAADVDSLLQEIGHHQWPRGLRVSLGRRAYQDARSDEYALGLDISVAELTRGVEPLRRAGSLFRWVRLPGPAIVLRDGRLRGVALYW